MLRIIEAAWFRDKRTAEIYAKQKLKEQTERGRKCKVTVYPAGDYKGAGWNVRIEEVEENA